jgi:23S rRNA (guanosine2251-2'-O)-methyltransferase
MGRRPLPKNYAGQKSPYPRLYGRHAVFAALDNPARLFRKLHLTPATAKTLDLPKGINVQFGDDHDLGRLVPADAPHQGYVLEVEPLEPAWLGDILAQGEADGDNRPILVLDQVTDPHNVGAIIRSAVAFNARALVTQDRHSPGESGALARAASGGLEALPWCRVVNLARALAEIGEAGDDLETALAGTRACLILGAEGEGMRPLTRENCDQLAKLPMSGAMESLNVSNAAAIALYAVIRRGL